MKTEFNARPVYLSREDRIHAHFLICFLSLVIYRYLEKKLSEEFTTTEIIETLRNYNFRELQGFGYILSYKYTEIIKRLNDSFNIITNKEVISYKNFKKIFSQTKK